MAFKRTLASSCGHTTDFYLGKTRSRWAPGKTKSEMNLPREGFNEFALGKSVLRR